MKTIIKMSQTWKINQKPWIYSAWNIEVHEGRDKFKVTEHSKNRCTNIILIFILFRNNSDETLPLFFMIFWEGIWFIVKESFLFW